MNRNKLFSCKSALNTTFRMLLVGLLISLPGLVFSESNSVQLSNEAGSISARSGQIMYFIDSAADGDEALSKIVALDDTRWVKSQNTIPNLGYDRSAHWFKLSLHNLSEESDWYLVFAYPLVSAMDVFFVQDGIVKSVFKAGDRFEFGARPIMHRDYLFPFTIERGSNMDVFVRMKTEYAIQFPVSFSKREAFWEEESKIIIVHGLFFGFLILMIFYNLFLFASTRDIAYFYYVLFTIFVGLFQVAQQGFGYQYLWSTNIWWQHRALPATCSIAFTFATLFVQTFLNTANTLPFLHRILNIFAFGALMVFVSALFVEQHYVQLINSYLGGFGALLMFVVGINSWRKGVKEARFFVFAWLVFNVSIFIFAGNKLGFLPRNFWTEYGVQIGTALELTLLSFALADRINSSRIHQEQLLQDAKTYEHIAKIANERALEVERVGKTRLERNVRSRTEQLQSALKELSLANRQLEEMSTVDSLTGVRSLAYFSEKISEEWERGIRDKSSLSLLLVSIDQFELIGDRYGYVAAEEILKNVSSVVKRRATRPADIVGRIATAEFGVLMPNTEIYGAQYVAQGIYDDVGSKPLNLGVCSISVTVSVSLVSRIPTKDFESDAILTDARKQLITIVQAGGDRIASVEAVENFSI